MKPFPDNELIKPQQSAAVPQTDFLFERRLNDHVYGIVAEFSSGERSCSGYWGSIQAYTTPIHVAGKPERCAQHL